MQLFTTNRKLEQLSDSTSSRVPQMRLESRCLWLTATLFRRNETSMYGRPLEQAEVTGKDCLQLNGIMTKNEWPSYRETQSGGASKGNAIPYLSVRSESDSLKFILSTCL
jgi:hypothetical protein